MTDIKTRAEFTVRPGVTFPNWAAISSETSREALEAILEVFGVEKCWDGYSESEDLVRRAVLEIYAEVGRAPSLAKVAERTALPIDEIRDLLASLRQRDLVVLSDSGDEITGAYPLTNADTEHLVRLGKTDIHAMCAIDALGTGAMYGKDVVIESSCRACGTPIRVTTSENGTALATVSPEQAVVWSGIRYENNRAADSLCTVLAFFCGDEHLQAWKAENHPDTRGYRLSMEEGLQTGMAIFTPMLANAVTADAAE